MPLWYINMSKQSLQVIQQKIDRGTFLLHLFLYSLTLVWYSCIFIEFHFTMALNVLLFFQLHLVRKIYFDVNLNLVFSLFIILNNALLLGHILRTLFLSYCMFWFSPLRMWLMIVAVTSMTLCLRFVIFDSSNVCFFLLRQCKRKCFLNSCFNISTAYLKGNKYDRSLQNLIL